MMIDFFGTPPGLLSLAGAAAVLVLISVVKRLAARARARRAKASLAPAATGSGPAPTSSGFAPASPGFTALPRWVVAAVAAWTVVGEEPVRGEPVSRGTPIARSTPVTPSAEAWKPGTFAQDPWLAAGWRNVGVTK
jgi:hypothetical protein